MDTPWLLVPLEICREGHLASDVTIWDIRRLATHTSSFQFEEAFSPKLDKSSLSQSLHTGDSLGHSNRSMRDTSVLSTSKVRFGPSTYLMERLRILESLAQEGSQTLSSGL